ncbi:nitrite reductase small subunit NirD [Streptomyces sp. JJ38]|uniref:nitrite reductase small subunit NirD n=1 Tax=Streptomyces sp. JJ38 TaxID=2738128 RepID=UPI001C57CAFA|nr:nitrite reductase small subunit NirD [Streptomyces sp. JJ38]MBW1598348.1 nitrite reductase small subunit NirD [Streptomyces sp. JJ38]
MTDVLIPEGQEGAAADTTTVARVEVRTADGWAAVCDREHLVTGRGVAALLPDGSQIALFLDRSGTVHAIGNRDPFTGAYVLSRGLLGSVDGKPFVASPLLKQRFDLATGRCLDDETVTVPAYATRLR